ncbi:MAG TPA: molecular chaperone HtpG [Fibrobacteria bacterium]|nr:molecular chaperone HtpG [Fibrobacteria bacterium]
MTAATQEKMEFQAEVKQLLNLMIHSLYSNKEIFLRELISNASDAIDKARYESLTRIEVLGEDKTFRIKVSADKENKILRISDNGVGMTRQEIIQNIGTIASSGTKKFVEQLSGDQKKDMSLIGQFGVGFYSVFMVADKVVLTTKRLGSDEPAMRWESAGDGSYTLEEADKKDRGTELEIHVKDEEKEFLEDYRIRSIIRKYSEYITHPISLATAPDKDGKEPKEEVLNDKPPIWRRSKSDIAKEQYEEFYKHLSYDEEAPLAWTHNQVEGALEYTTLLYIPAKAPFDLYNPEKSNGLNLYVKRVFIMNDCKELLPSYLRFARGIVDSEDLPLNVSREILQKNAVIQKINKAATKKVLQLLETMSKEEKDKYRKFWKEFGNVVKEGFHMNWENLDELKRLIRFESNKTAAGEYVGLEEYVIRMKAEQKDVYYISGESRSAVEHSPHLEVFKSKDIEVLYLIDPIDEWVVQSLGDFDGKKLLNVAKGDLDLGELSKEEKKSQKEAEGTYKKFMKDFEEKTGDLLKEVRVTTRLKESPCCLVADESDMGANMERILKMANQKVTASKRILEINPDHAIMQSLRKMYDADPANPKLKDWYGLLVDQALLAEGSEIKDPAGYVSKVNGFLADVLAKA